jgi:hypothetical protein
MPPRLPDPVEQSGLIAGADDEELPGRIAPRWRTLSPRQRRLAVPVFLVAAVAGAVGVAAVVAGQRPAQRSGLALPPSPSASAVDELPAVPQMNPNLPARCAQEVACTSADAVPPGTSDAIAEYLVGANERVTYTVTQTDTRRLVYRAVNATAGSIELLVIVTVPDAVQSPATETADPSPGAAIRYVRRQVGRYEVQVQYTGPPGGTPPVTRAVQLSQDPRLLELD